MKKFIVCLFAVSALMSANAQPAQDWANFKRYEKANIEVKQLSQEQRKVVFMGNSITDNWYSRHGEFFKENGYIGRGIGGWLTGLIRLTGLAGLTGLSVSAFGCRSRSWCQCSTVYQIVDFSTLVNHYLALSGSRLLKPLRKVLCIRSEK